MPTAIPGATDWMDTLKICSQISKGPKKKLKPLRKLSHSPKPWHPSDEVFKKAIEEEKSNA